MLKGPCGTRLEPRNTRTWVRIHDLFSPGCVNLDRVSVLPMFKFSHLGFGENIRKVPRGDQPLLFLLPLLCIVALSKGLCEPSW